MRLVSFIDSGDLNPKTQILKLSLTDIAFGGGI
jgi:hypothetical protein